MNNKTTNVLMISYYYLPEYSGAAKLMSRIVKCGAKYNVKFIVISARLKLAWPRTEMIDGAKIIRIPSGSQRSLLLFWFGLITQFFKLRSKIDLVFVNGLKPDHSIAIWLAKLMRKPSVGRLSIANSDINFNNQGRIIGKLSKWFLKKANRYIAISSALTKEIVDSGLSSEKCLMIPNGVDIDKFCPVNSEIKNALRKELNIPSQLIVLFVGVIDYRKGVDILIHAFKNVLQRISGVKLLLIGPKNREDHGSIFYNRMRQFVVDFNIADYVEFRDYTRSIFEYYQAADLFVLPSRQEGMPNVILEAMASGLPIVGTKISGTEDLIESGVNGLIVPPENGMALSDAIVEILKNKDIRKKMGEMSVQKARNIYDANKIDERYFNLLKTLVSSKKNSCLLL